MNAFEMALPESEAEALAAVHSAAGRVAFLAGGTDLVNQLRAGLIEPVRVIDLKRIPSLRRIERTSNGVLIGATATLFDLQRHLDLRGERGLLQAIDGVHSVQILASGTVGGDLCHAPNCWYYRRGDGLLAWQNRESLPLTGDGRQHAIFGNQGPAKFVSASRLAPVLIARQATVRVIGPALHEAAWWPLEELYVTPLSVNQSFLRLAPGQLVTHIHLPAMTESMVSGHYDVLPSEGLDWPLVSASVCAQVDAARRVLEAAIVLGHAAPVPWRCSAAATLLRGYSGEDEEIERVAERAVLDATPLPDNEFRVDLARVAIRRAWQAALGRGESNGSPEHQG